MLATKLQEAAGNATQPAYIEDVFSTYLYKGNGSTQTINNGIDLASKGGLVWIKARDIATEHNWQDTARGVNNTLRSDTEGAQITDSTSINAFNANGFSMGSYAKINLSGYNYASWTFREQPKFYTQELISHTNGTATNIDLSTLGTVGYLHAKITNTTGDWIAWHRSLTAGNNLRLNTTAAQSTTNAWLSVSGTTATLSASAPTGSYIVHAFAHNAGGFGLTGTDNVISCGSFNVDGSGNATVDLGYEPQWVMIKTYEAAANWAVFDNMRGMPVGNTNVARLFPNTSDAESSSTDFNVSPTATGFTAKATGYAGSSTDGFIYIAIRRGPMKTPTSGTSVFTPVTANNTTGTVNTTGFPVDLQLVRLRALANDTVAVDRLRGISTTTTQGERGLLTDTLDAEFAGTTVTRAWDNTGFQTATGYSGYSDIYWNFRRAPSFFDEVCYTGTGSATTFNHNLGVAPELVIFKNRSGTSNWFTAYGFGASTFNRSYLNLTNAKDTWTYGPSGVVFTGQPTATGLPLCLDGFNDSGINYVAYLFASCPGVSKVGSYTGTGTTQQINCGFTAGARFVLIKRTDSTGDWYVWDSARGIVTGNDPYLLLNSTAAEVTTTDYIDPYSAGFEISSTAPAAINASGGSFIYLAIA